MYQEVLDGASSFEMHFNAMFPVDVLAALTHPLNIRHHHVGLVIVEAHVVPAVTRILVGSVGFLLFDACPVQSPYWILASFKCLSEVIYQSIARSIKEAILIRVNDPSLNRNIGKYQLPHIWDEVLVMSPEVKLK